MSKVVKVKAQKFVLSGGGQTDEGRPVVGPYPLETRLPAALTTHFVTRQDAASPLFGVPNPWGETPTVLAHHHTTSKKSLRLCVKNH